MKKIILINLLLISISVFGQHKTKILLIGTFHYDNPGLDVNRVPDFDVLNTNVQEELNLISKRIALFNPTKFFIEFDYIRQLRLDSLYNLYLEGKYSEFVEKNFPKNRYYSESEIFQLAFKSGKKAHVKRLNGVNTYAEFPYDSLKEAMKAANQLELLKSMETSFPKATSQSLITRTLELNTSLSRARNRSWYIKYANRGGEAENFVGAYLASEWFKRNLYMYSLVQKLTDNSDDRIVLLLGAGHISMIEQFIKDDDRFEIVELKDILSE
jgi:hypothetical protein